jgi:hypothetical protein
VRPTRARAATDPHASPHLPVPELATKENRAKTLLVFVAAQSAWQVYEAKLGMAHFWTRDSATSCARALAALGQVEQSTSICDRLHSSLS